MADVRSEYVILGSKLGTGRQGEADICTRLDGMYVSDEELVKIKNIQKQAAEEMENLLKEKPAP